MAAVLTLEDGAAELTRSGRQVWASDSDELFPETFEDFVGPEDAEYLIDYLADAGYVSPHESVVIRCASEST